MMKPSYTPQVFYLVNTTQRTKICNRKCNLVLLFSLLYPYLFLLNFCRTRYRIKIKIFDTLTGPELECVTECVTLFYAHLYYFIEPQYRIKHLNFLLWISKTLPDQNAYQGVHHPLYPLLQVLRITFLFMAKQPSFFH